MRPSSWNQVSISISSPLQGHKASANHLTSQAAHQLCLHAPARVVVHLNLYARGHEDERELHHHRVCGKACLRAAPQRHAVVACDLLLAHTGWDKRSAE